MPRVMHEWDLVWLGRAAAIKAAAAAVAERRRQRGGRRSTRRQGDPIALWRRLFELAPRIEPAELRDLTAGECPDVVVKGADPFVSAGGSARCASRPRPQGAGRRRRPRDQGAPWVTCGSGALMGRETPGRLCQLKTPDIRPLAWTRSRSRGPSMRERPRRL